MTSAEEVNVVELDGSPKVNGPGPRGTIFGRDAINRHQLLRALTVDGQDKVRLDDIQKYVNKSQKQAQHLGWYKFAALFGFIIIVLQCFTTFGVAMWANTSSWGSHTTGGTLTSNDGAAIVATGFTPSDMAIEDIYASLNSGVAIDKLSGEMVNDNGDISSFSFEIVGFVCANSVANVCTLYTNTEATIYLTEETATVNIGTDDFGLMDVGTRRRLGAADSAMAASTYGTNTQCAHQQDLLYSVGDADFATQCGQCLNGGGGGACASTRFWQKSGDKSAACSGAWADKNGSWAGSSQAARLNDAFCPDRNNCMEGRVGVETTGAHWEMFVSGHSMGMDSCEGVTGRCDHYTHICIGLGFTADKSTYYKGYSYSNSTPEKDCTDAVEQMNRHGATSGPQSGCFVDKRNPASGDVSQHTCNNQGLGYCASVSDGNGYETRQKKCANYAHWAGGHECNADPDCSSDCAGEGANATCTCTPSTNTGVYDSKCATKSASDCHNTFDLQWKKCKWVASEGAVCNAMLGCKWRSGFRWKSGASDGNDGYMQINGEAKQWTWRRHTKPTCGKAGSWRHNCRWFPGGVNMSTHTNNNSESRCDNAGGNWRAQVSGKCCHHGSD